MAGFLTPNPNFSWGQFGGNALAGIGQGLLAYGAGGQLRQQAPLIAIQGMQQAQQAQAEQQQRALQTQSLTQQLAMQQQQMSRQAAADDAAASQKQQYLGLLGGQPIQGPTPSGAPLDIKSPVNPALANLPAGVQQSLPLMDPSQGLGLIAQMETRKPEAQPDNIQEYEYAQKNGFKGSLLDYRRALAEAGRSQSPQFPKYGMAPVWGQDKDGNPVLMQLGANGTVIQPTMPQGVTPTPGVSFQNTGTSIVPTSNKTGLPAAPAIAIDNTGKAAATALGTVQGQIQSTLPTSLSNADQTLALIDDLKKDPAIDEATGMKGLLMNRIPTTKAYAYTQKVKELKGRAFLQAYTSLKGAGAISEGEGVKAESALARLDTAQSTEDYKKALDDFAEVVKTGKANLIKQSGQSGATGQAAPSGGSQGSVQKWTRDAQGNPVPVQ